MSDQFSQQRHLSLQLAVDVTLRDWLRVGVMHPGSRSRLLSLSFMTFMPYFLTQPIFCFTSQSEITAHMSH